MAHRRGGRRARGREPWQALHAALRALLDADLEGAEAALSGLVRGDSDQVAGYLALAQLYRRRGELGRAIRIHQNLLLRRDLAEEDRAAALAGLARDYQQGGFLRRALAAWRDVLARNPRDEEALRALAELAVDLRDFDLALDALRRLGRLRGRGAAGGGVAGGPVGAKGPGVAEGAGAGAEAELLLRMAEAALAAGRAGDARRWLRRVLRGDPQSATGWALLGELEAQRGRLARALPAWQRALALAESGEAQRMLLRVEAACGRLGAVADFEAFLRAQLVAREWDVAARCALVRCLAQRGEADEALALAELGLQENPAALALHAARAQVLLDEGREAEAAKALDALLRLLARRGMLGAALREQHGHGGAPRDEMRGGAAEEDGGGLSAGGWFGGAGWRGGRG